MEINANKFKPNEILRFIRQNANKTQQEMADCIKKSKSWVKHNEQGLTRYYFDDLIQITNICNLEIIIREKNKERKKTK